MHSQVETTTGICFRNREIYVLSPNQDLTLNVDSPWAGHRGRARVVDVQLASSESCNPQASSRAYADPAAIAAAIIAVVPLARSHARRAPSVVRYPPSRRSTPNSRRLKRPNEHSMCLKGWNSARMDDHARLRLLRERGGHG